MKQIIEIQLPKDHVNLERLKSRFLNHVEKSNMCWKWLGFKLKTGYGRFGINGIIYYAHRVSYTIFRNNIPEGLVVDHLCKNTWCVNPEHMEIVRQQENVLRGESQQSKNAKKTHCPQGHIYDTNNTRFDIKNRRSCKICTNIRRDIWYKKNYEREKAKKRLYWDKHKNKLNQKRRLKSKLDK
jgi:hypothetical protein